MPSISNADLIEHLKADTKLYGNKDARAALDEMATLDKYCQWFNINDKVRSVMVLAKLSNSAV